VERVEEKGQSVTIPGFSKQFEEPAAQARIGLVSKRMHSLLRLLMSMRKQKMKAIFLQLGIAFAHQAHAFLESWDRFLQRTLLFLFEARPNEHGIEHLAQSYALLHCLTILITQSAGEPLNVGIYNLGRK
jgi:hypothetical protein